MFMRSTFDEDRKYFKSGPRYKLMHDVDIYIKDKRQKDVAVSLLVLFKIMTGIVCIET